jgi:hypothetical protein
MTGFDGLARDCVQIVSGRAGHVSSFRVSRGCANGVSRDEEVGSRRD